MTGVLSCNIDNNQSFARYDTIASNHQIKLEESYLRGIIYIDTQDEIFPGFQVIVLLPITAIATGTLIHLQTTRNLGKTLVESITILNMV